MSQNKKILVWMAEIDDILPTDNKEKINGRRRGTDSAEGEHADRVIANSHLCPGHRAELEEYRSDRGRAESAAAEFLLQRMYSELENNVQPEEWHWIRGEHGKPEIPELAPWQFNLTHGGGWTACALACGFPVGVDLQPVGPVREAVVRRFFTDWEREMLRSAKEPEESFAMIWAAREAWCKWDGRGITLDPVQKGYRWETDRDPETICRNCDKLQTEKRVILWNPGEPGNIKGTVWENGHAVCRMAACIVKGMALAVCGIPVVK